MGLTFDTNRCERDTWKRREGECEGEGGGEKERDRGGERSESLSPKYVHSLWLCKRLPTFVLDLTQPYDIVLWEVTVATPHIKLDFL